MRSGLLIGHPSMSLLAPSLQLPPAHTEKETVPLRHPNRSYISLSAHLLPSGFFCGVYLESLGLGFSAQRYDLEREKKLLGRDVNNINCSMFLGNV